MNTKGSSNRYDYEQLYSDLVSVSDRSKLFKTVRAAMVKRGRYKRKPRGAWVKYGVPGSRLNRE